MRKRKNIMLSLCLFFCLGVLLTGCTKAQEEQIEITMIHGWGSTEADHVAMRQIYEDFEKEHPGIHINLISMPSSDDVISKVSDLLTVGEIPDIVFTGGIGRETIYSFMVEEGYALDLLPYLEKDEEFAGSVSEVVSEYWKTEDGKLYTVSDVLLMGGYWYNQKIFAKAGILQAPSTWEEWFAACEKIQQLGERITPMVLDANHSAYLMAAILANEQPEEQQKQAAMDTQSPAFDEMLKKFSQIAQYATLAGDYEYRDTLSAFNEEESAIYINGVWANSMIRSELQVAYAPFPSDDGEGIATLSACVGYILGNTEDEERMSASVEFLKYMLSDEVAVRIMEETGQMPSNPNVQITREQVGDRMYQAVSCVQNAGILIQTPENLWNLSRQEEYSKNMILYLQGRISEGELRKRIASM